MTQREEHERYLLKAILSQSITSENPSREAIKKAYDELERRGAITTISTKGTFISENTKQVTKGKINEKINLIKNEKNNQDARSRPLLRPRFHCL